MPNRSIKEKPFVVVDIFSGKYTLENEGHEKYNTVRNIFTGKFYGYAPREGKLNVLELGASKYDETVHDVMVIYVEKLPDSNNRVISAFVESATVYPFPITDYKLGRNVKSINGYETASYCIESDDLVKINDIKDAEKFVIPIRTYSSNMFRSQRFYKGKYPELDEKILDYLEHILTIKNCPKIKEGDNDDGDFQEQLQEDIAGDSHVESNSDKQPEFSSGSQIRQVKKSITVSKSVLKDAQYQCQVDKNHLTFKNKVGHQYMEGHHLIPCTPSNVERFWRNCKVNIDCKENIVCICPTCHRQIHYGSPVARENVLRKLYNIKYEDLRKIGINLSFDDLLSFYP